MISVLILTFNEEENIAKCLKSVASFDDVVVIDSFSTDRTVQVARDGGARVLQNRFVNFAEQRNFGLDHAELKHDWVLHLDADEVVTPELRAELLAIAESGSTLAYRTPAKLMFEDHWLRFCGAYPNYQVRFGRRDTLRFKQVGHGQRENLDARGLGTLKEPMLHYSFSKGLDDWFSKHNRYAAAEAAADLSSRSNWISNLGALLSGNTTERRRALKSLARDMPGRPLLRFTYMYVFQLGFLDGGAGWRYCWLQGLYESMIVLKKGNCSESYEFGREISTI